MIYRSILFLGSILLLSNTVMGQTGISMLDFKPNMIDKKYYKGTIKTGKCWKDKNGENLLILTETGIMTGKEDYSRKAELYAYNFIKTGSEWQLLWRVYDFVDECQVDITCEFFTNSLSVTDIDKNGEAEASFIYALSCKGDVSPDEKKLIMYEGKKKFAIRGETTVLYEKKTIGGSRNIDKTFQTAPAGFLQHASKLWSQFGTTKY